MASLAVTSSKITVLTVNLNPDQQKISGDSAWCHVRLFYLINFAYLNCISSFSSKPCCVFCKQLSPLSQCFISCIGAITVTPDNILTFTSVPPKTSKCLIYCESQRGETLSRSSSNTEIWVIKELCSRPVHRSVFNQYHLSL